MKLRYFQRGFNYSQDGPGNRLVYHLQGCNLRCPWCSNPEGMSLAATATEVSVSDVINEIVSCQPMFWDDGGVTFTGGEATLQLDALYSIMQAAKEKGISTAIETNATVSGIEKLASVCDFFMIDFKHPDAEKLKAVTGGDVNVIKNNILALSKAAHLHLRIPLIHGFNDDKSALFGFTEFFSALKNGGADFDIELLPYHEFGKEKWQKIGMEYTVVNGFVKSETVKEFINEFKKHGFTVIRT